MTLRIVADAAIPWLDEAFACFGTIERMPGAAITAEVLERADVLLVRTVTRVDAELLARSSVQFVGTATAGTEHVDLDLLTSRGIAFAHAPGANAQAVAEYVMTALFLVAASSPRSEVREHGPMGIVGFGHIGRRVAQIARSLGIDVLVCDPPLAHARATPRGLEGFEPTTRAMIDNEPFVALRELLRRAQVLSLHVPLVHDGMHPTHHLVDAGALAQFSGTLVIHTCRGGVVDESALSPWLGGGRRAVLDVWEHEPFIDPGLLTHPNVSLATPHVAGYSEDGKARATAAVHAALARHLGRPATFSPQDVLPSRAKALSVADEGTTLERIAALLGAAVPLRADDARLRALARLAEAERGEAFEALRRGYAFRRELSRIAVRMGEHRDASLPRSLHEAATRLGFALG